MFLKKECKENGDLYGSIKPKEITNMITSQLNADVSPSQILLKEELNKIGSFKASINFHSEVQATISIKIDKIQLNNFSTALKKSAKLFLYRCN